MPNPVKSYLSKAEERGLAARQKYGAMTISEILARIIVWTLLLYMVIVFACIALYFSPVSDRLLATILLIFVLCEMATEYALWAFTYQGMRKTEAPLADLQQFSVITKEGWKRVEMVLDWTAPIFQWIDDLIKRSGLGWRKDEQKSNQIAPANQGPDARQLEELLTGLTRAIQDLSGRIAKLERDSKK